MPARARKIAGIILAAGASSRMGQNKLLLPLAGESLVRRAVRQALEAGLDPVVVVLGGEAEKIRAELEHLSCHFAYNPDYLGGISTSFRAGISSLQEDVEAAVFLLADQPFVTTAMLRQLLETYRQRRVPLVVADYEGVIAPPHLFGREFFPELGSGHGDHGARRLLHQHFDQAAVLSFPKQALFDIDDPKDYQRAQAMLRDSSEA